MNWYIKCMTEKYADFSGRASRSEYWYFTLVSLIIAIILDVISGVLQSSVGDIAELLPLLYSLAVLIPSIAVGARRLHDTGRSGWWQLIGLTIVGIIVLIVFLVQDSSFDRNQYGPNPKTPGTSV
ncbi:MAG: DUF805 domain-containing protein [Cyanobacteria bacterium P01_A01_bin.116]